MKLKTKIVTTLGIILAAAGAVAGVNHLMRTPVLTEAPPVPTMHGPRVITFPDGAAQLSSLKTEPVRLIALPVAEPVTARIVYDENVTSRISSPVSGRVTGLHAQVGDKIAAGGALLTMESADLAAAEADWQKARTDETRKTRAYERARALYEREVVARKDLESAEADFQQAQAETRRAQMRMKLFNSSGHEHGRFVLKSPIAGQIADRQANPGMEVRPDLQNPLYVVTDISRLWVLADVPERHLADLKPGQAVSVITDAYAHQSFPATIERIGLALDPVTRRIQVRCVIKNPDGRLKPEMFARVYFLADSHKKGVQLPNSSLISEGLYSHVFVETKPGRFERRRVNVVLKGPDSSFVDTPFADGERVVTHGALLLNAEAASNVQ